MIGYCLVAAVTIGLACLVDNGQKTMEGQLYRTGRMTRRQGINALGLLAVFTVLFLLSAFRLEVGNDYGTYVDTFHEIYVGGYVVTEPLFNAVVKGLYEIAGGEKYLLVFGVFAFATLGIFLKALYEQTDSFALAFFLFMTLGIYFRTFNTVRYYFVLALTMYSLRYVLKREYDKFILLILLAAMFHKSVLVVIPLYLIAEMDWKKWQIALLVSGSIGMLLFQNKILEVALRLYPSYRDTIYLETETGLSGNLMSIFRCLWVLILAWVCCKDTLWRHRESAFYFKLNLMALVLYLCGSFLPLVGRIGYYLMTPHIFFIPLMIGSVEEGKKRKVITLVVIISCVIYFLLFLKSADQPGVRVLPYKSWLFYEKEFLNAETIF